MRSISSYYSMKYWRNWWQTCTSFNNKFNVFVDWWTFRLLYTINNILCIFQESKDKYNPCVGALISNRHVLTAGHCVCLQSNNTNLPCEKGKINYNPKEVLKAVILIRDGPFWRSNIYNIDPVIVHVDWDGTWTSFPGKHKNFIFG